MKFRCTKMTGSSGHTRETYNIHTFMPIPMLTMNWPSVISEINTTPMSLTPSTSLMYPPKNGKIVFGHEYTEYIRLKSKLNLLSAETDELKNLSIWDSVLGRCKRDYKTAKLIRQVPRINSVPSSMAYPSRQECHSNSRSRKDPDT